MEAGTKQHIITSLAGLSNIPSDFTCEDGSTIFIDGIRNVNGEMKPIQRINVSSDKQKENCVLAFVHEYCGQKRFIYVKSSTKLAWAVGEDGSPTEISGVSVKDLKRIVAVGRTLVVLDSEKLQYLTWDGSEYVVSTDSEVYPIFKFSLKRTEPEGSFTDMHQITAATETGDFIWKYREDHTAFDINTNNGALKEQGGDLEKEQNLFIAANNHLLEKLYKRKHFIFPFFAVAALKTFDGSYKYITPPQLMSTFLKGNHIAYIYNLCYNEKWKDTDYLWAALIGEWKLLMYNVSGQDLSSLNTNINGVNLFSSVDIFVTRQSSTAEFDYDAREWGRTGSDDWETIRIEEDGIQKEYGWPVPFFQTWDWSGHDADNSDKDKLYTTFAPYKRKSAKEIKEDLIENLGQFRKIASIPWEDFISKYGENSSEVDVEDYMEENTLITLDNQDLLTFSSKYKDWGKSCPSDIDSVNRRLIKVGGKQGFAIPRYFYHSHLLSLATTESSSNIYHFVIQINTDEGVKYIHFAYDQTWGSIAWQTIFTESQFWYYPDPRATHFWVYRKDKTDTSYYLLFDHDFQHDSPIGGAYYFSEYPSALVPISTKTSKTLSGFSDDSGDMIADDNLIKQSYADNVFNDENEVSIGQGDIIKIGSLTTALTQDAYKVSTIIALTTQGIWSVACDSTGLFSSVSPAFSREVCINANSVVMTDSKIYFASKKGVICVVATAEQGVDNVTPKFSIQGISPKTISYRSSDTTIDDETALMSLYDYFEKINAEGEYVYDYYSQAILMLYPGRPDYFVLDINSGTIYYTRNSLIWVVDKNGNKREASSYLRATESYPDVYLSYTVEENAASTIFAKLSDTPLRQDDTNEYSYEIVSRPIKLDGAMYLKSLRRVRELYTSSRADACKLELYGTNKLSEPWIKLTSLGGKPYRFYMYRMTGTLDATDSIAGLMLETQVRYTDKPH